MMKEIIQFENHHLEIWRRPRQRTMNLRVRPDGALRVTCNRRVPKGEIFQFIREQHDFISRSLQKIEEHKLKYPPKQLESGETFLYFGEPLRLQLVWSWTSRIRVRIFEREIEMVAPITSTPLERQLALHKFIQKQAREVLISRLRVHALNMKLCPVTVAIRGQKTRWGSCSARGEISLNWKLLAAPNEIIDYVLIHELAHLRHMDHSPRFWSLVERFYPDFSSARRWLRNHEAAIAAQFQKVSIGQKTLVKPL